MEIVKKQELGEVTLMKRAIFAILVIAACSIPSFAKYSGGTGEPNTPYQIATAADLNDIGNHTEDFNKCFIMTADVDLSQYTGMQFKIIGPDIGAKSFRGVFDGNGHSIHNLTYTATADVDYVGLFGLTANATIKNLGVEDVNLSAEGSHIGGLVGSQNYGFIINCYSTGSVTRSLPSNSFISSTPNTGGLVGGQYYSSSVTDCYSTATVTSYSYSDSSFYSYSYTGGLVGYQYSPDSSIINCFSTGSVRSYSYYPTYTSYTSFSNTGGLVGQQGGSISNCYSTSPVISYFSSNYSPVPLSSYCGGLVGEQFSGTISNCYSTDWLHILTLFRLLLPLLITVGL